MDVTAEAQIIFHLRKSPIVRHVVDSYLFPLKQIQYVRK